MVKVLTWNVNTDMRAEAGGGEYEKFSWNNRKDSVVDTIVKSDADVVCLQEMREESISDLIGSSSLRERYNFDYAKTNGTGPAFYLAILHRKELLTCVEKQVYWMGDGGCVQHFDSCSGSNGFGRIVLQVALKATPYPDPKWSRTSEVGEQMNRLSFRVFCTHFGLGEKERLTEARVLGELVRGKSPCIVCGDFNSFPDANGGLQMHTICKEGNLANAAEYGAQIQTLSGVSIVGTQIPYAYDNMFKEKERVPFKKGAQGGRLDHILYSPDMFTPNGSAKLLTYKIGGGIAEAELLGHNPDLTVPPVFPSDHLPLIFELDFTNN